MNICKQLFHKSRSPQLFNRIVFLRTPQNAAQHPQPAVNHYRHIAGMFFFGNGLQPLLMEDVLVISRKFEYMRYIPAMLYIGEFYQFNLSSCIRQQNSLTAQFVSFSLANLANIFYPPRFLQ